ncbi:MAG: ABC transporter ATP-binding protein [Pseudomonadota bacterium]
MSENALGTKRTIPELVQFFRKILGPEKRFYALAIVYGIGISLLTLATPISVQMLVNSIVSTGLTLPLVVLSLTLFFLLSLSGLLYALRTHLVDVFGRRFYARMVSDIALRSIYALNPYFEDHSTGPLFNRYFDIIIVMKRIPYLLVGGFSILLQAAVGFILTSLYHPAFLAFNAVVIALIWLTWLIWGRSAIKSAMAASHKKHQTAAWLESLAASNGFFKTQSHIDQALSRTEAATAAYMKEHVRHFRQYFSQTIAFLFIYALASAALLGLGGWLVIQGQLTIGQLVAAELILSVVFFGISQLGTYMAYFYDLCAAVEELSLFHEIEQEDLSEEDDDTLSGDSTLAFVKASGVTRGRNIVLNFEVPAGARVLACVEDHTLQRLFTNFMKRHELPKSGYVTVGGHDTKVVQAYALRREIIVLDRPTVIDTTIRDYLSMSTNEPGSRTILEALDSVELSDTVGQLDKGLDTEMAVTGWPLSMTETLRLRLASALIARPRILVIGPMYDVLPAVTLHRAMDSLQSCCNTTIVHFSLRHDNGDYSQYLYLGHEQQPMFDDFDSFDEHILHHARQVNVLSSAIENRRVDSA